MNDAEKKILNGIFHYNQVVNDAIYYKAAELNWLIENDLNKGNEWKKEGEGFKSCGDEMNEGEANLCQLGELIHKIEKSLSYLNGKGFIEYKKNRDSFHINLTATGIDFARKLQTRIGRVNLWYQENKDSVIWLLITIITSMVVTIITALIIEYLK